MGRATPPGRRRAGFLRFTIALALAAAPLAAAADDASAVREALEHPRRPTADRERDASRRPAEVLALVGLRPGMHVADLMAGRGWSTELLARVVGPDGRVYAQNNAISSRRHGAALAQRVASSGLSNVVVLERELEETGLPEGSLDAVFMLLFYHDTFWMGVDREAMNHGIFAALRPGGIFCLSDHRAEAGSGDRDVKRLHRVDPELVKREVLAAGFTLETESPLLHVAADDHTRSAFDPAIRGRTDRFLLVFRKPD